MRVQAYILISALVFPLSSFAAPVPVNGALVAGGATVATLAIMGGAIALGTKKPSTNAAAELHGLDSAERGRSNFQNPVEAPAYSPPRTPPPTYDHTTGGHI